MKPDFPKMERDVLRQYVIEHPDDREAFESYVDRLDSRSPTRVYPANLSPEEIQQAVRDYLAEKTLDRSEP